MSEHTCEECKLFAFQGNDPHWGRCDIRECFGSVDVGKDESACPAFDDGKFEKAVGILIERAEIAKTWCPEYARKLLGTAIEAVESARKEKP